VPRVDDWFDGCRFAPRCTHIRAICQARPVDMSAVRLTQSVRCLYPLT
jgi:ABC-type dipeptide/oligopeptide/nickel transport system ATPase component